MLYKGNLYTGNQLFSSLLTKLEPPSYVGLLCSPSLHAPLKQDQSHFTTLHLDINVCQVKCNGPSNRHLQYIITRVHNIRERGRVLN